MVAILQGFFAQISVQLEMGISLEVLVDGRKAIENLVERPFDLVFLDLGLPLIPGHEVLRRARAAAIYTPIFVLSSSNNKSDVHRSYLYAANGYLCKGGSPANLRASLLSICQCYLKHLILPIPS